MACDCCQRARECRDQGFQYRFFSPTCLWCGARLIQAIGRLPIARDSSVSRRRAVLDDWMQYGHAEQELRELAKASDLPLEPPPSTGSAASGEPERPKRTKRR